jgi:alkylhydroperoxidase family enzyme
MKGNSMNQRVKPDPRLAPLPVDTHPELKEAFETNIRNLGFIPNSTLILQRKPKLVKAFAQLNAAVWDPAGEVPVGFRRLVAHVASRAHGCHY